MTSPPIWRETIPLAGCDSLKWWWIFCQIVKSKFSGLSYLLFAITVPHFKPPVVIMTDFWSSAGSKFQLRGWEDSWGDSSFLTCANSLWRIKWLLVESVSFTVISALQSFPTLVVSTENRHVPLCKLTWWTCLAQAILMTHINTERWIHEPHEKFDIQHLILKDKMKCLLPSVKSCDHNDSTLLSFQVRINVTGQRASHSSRIKVRRWYWKPFITLSQEYSGQISHHLKNP